MTTLITAFKAYLLSAGYGKGSLSLLPAMASDFLEYCGHPDIHQVEPRHIQDYHRHLRQRPNKHHGGGLSESYVHHHVFALRVLFAWLEQSGEIGHNPISAIRFPQPEKKSRQPLSSETIERLFAACSDLRERAVLHLFYSCGLRRSEGESLNTRDIHFTRQLLYVRSGKGAKRRVVPMPAQVAADLENYYLGQRVNQKARQDDTAFMLNKTGGRMSGQGYGTILSELLVRAGLPPGTTLHHLRHSIATHLLASGVSMELLREFLGHSHLETTQIYAGVAQQQVLTL